MSTIGLHGAYCLTEIGFNELHHCREFLSPDSGNIELLPVSGGSGKPWLDWVIQENALP